MASHIWLFSALLLIAGCHCAPRQIGGGFRIGAQSRSDLTLGGDGKLSLEGPLLSGEGKGLAAGEWNGGLYGGGYANLDDKYIAMRGAVNPNLAASLEPGAKVKIGMDKDSKFPLALQGSLGNFKRADLGANGILAFGKDAKDLSELYRNKEYGNPHMRF